MDANTAGDADVVVRVSLADLAGFAKTDIATVRRLLKRYPGLLKAGALAGVQTAYRQLKAGGMLPRAADDD